MKQAQAHLEEARDGAQERAADGEECHEAAGVDELLDAHLQARRVLHGGQPRRRP
jgi:hypothetical protein